MRVEVLYLMLACQFGLSIQECPECACCYDGENACDIRKNCTNGCIAGYYGDKCIEECPENCEICDNGHTCTECKKGYYTSHCNVPCGKGCLNNTCEINGSCQCKSSNFLNDKCSQCLLDKYGDECNNTCPSNCITCSSDTKCPFCEHKLYYGTYCQYRCSLACDPGKCHKDTGQCLPGCKPGYTGDRCDTCSPGLYGKYCDLNCTENCSSCLSKTNCTECKKGLYGKICTLLCPPGCKGHCTISDGQCLECKPGLNGVFCNTCIDGRYGYNCTQFCNDTDVNCRMCFADEVDEYVGCSLCNSGYYPVTSPGNKHSTCMHCPITCIDNKCDTSGICLSGCADTFYGSRCENDCSIKCMNKTCNHITGECLHGCIDGYEVVSCVQASKGTETKLTVIIASSAAGGIAFVTLVVILGICLIRRKRKRRLPSNRKCEENDYTQDMPEICKLDGDAELDMTYAQPFKPKQEDVDGTSTKYNSVRDNENKITDANTDYAVVNNGKFGKEENESNEEVYDTTHDKKTKVPLNSNNEYAILSLKSNKPICICKPDGTEPEDAYNVYDTTEESKSKNMFHPDNDYALINNKGNILESDTKNPLYDTTSKDRNKKMRPVNNDYDVFSIDCEQASRNEDRHTQ